MTQNQHKSETEPTTRITTNKLDQSKTAFLTQTSVEREEKVENSVPKQSIQTKIAQFTTPNVESDVDNNATNNQVC